MPAPKGIPCKKNICSFPGKVFETCGIKLCIVWDVEANQYYNIPQHLSHKASSMHSSMSGKGIVVMRTLSGSGKLYHEEGEFDLTSGSLFLFDFERLKSYHSVEADWCYWWFEINCDIPLHIPRHKVLNVPVDERDNEEFEQIFNTLRRESSRDQFLATASFIRLLYKWWADCPDSKPNLPHEEKILKLIDEMHKRVYTSFSVDEMAKIAGLSVTGFRKAFREVTGKSPKMFFEQLKLSMAMELLRFGHYNVKEVAEMLGFCDPYHFSKMFNKHFGQSPSKI